MGCATKDQTAQGPRVFIRSKATCAAPLCEVLTPCRGQRPHHVQRDRIGTWEVSGLAVRCCVSGTVRIGKVRSRSAATRDFNHKAYAPAQKVLDPSQARVTNAL